ncbi:hypothetical protein ILUMI_10960 [Ignelater luminosus]|uniref:DDE-1 domain-containing protein n=1 Tax=Ignelater luminosus TaxID=2038154 RepID=A0A8K0CZD5_IGNLU|nr:hypothetical protein ILUMI_10960 [Ignelater luminosus]
MSEVRNAGQEVREIWKILLEKQKIFVGWMACKVADYIVAKHCNTTETCAHCAQEGHEHSNCPNREREAKCANCKSQRKDYNHLVADRGCAMYRSAIDKRENCGRLPSAKLTNSNELTWPAIDLFPSRGSQSGHNLGNKKYGTRVSELGSDALQRSLLSKLLISKKTERLRKAQGRATREKVEGAIMSQKKNEAPGHDGIEVVALQKACIIIEDGIYNLFKACIRHGKFPTRCKKGKIKVLLKSKKTTSDMSVASLLEKVMRRLREEGRLALGQFEFTKNKSTEDAVITTGLNLHTCSKKSVCCEYGTRNLTVEGYSAHVAKKGRSKAAKASNNLDYDENDFATLEVRRFQSGDALPNLYSTPVSITSTKYKHLQKVNKVIDKDFHSFITSCQHGTKRNKKQKTKNLDETPLSHDPSKRKIVRAKSKPSSRTTSSPGQGNTTVLSAVSASDADEEHAFDDIAYAASPKGWMETDFFRLFLQKSLIPAFGDARPVLLIYDGHSTQINVKLIKHSRSNDITIVKLPPMEKQHSA